MNESWAIVIAAIITALTTLIIAKFDDIVNVLQKAPRKVSGRWEVTSKILCDGAWVGDFQLKLKQSGKKLAGEMSVVKGPEGIRSDTHKWSGKMISCDYVAFQCECITPGSFMISTGLLFIHGDGKKMSGYCVSNSEAGSDRTSVRVTEMKRIE